MTTKSLKKKTKNRKGYFRGKPKIWRFRGGWGGKFRVTGDTGDWEISGGGEASFALGGHRRLEDFGGREGTGGRRTDATHRSSWESNETREDDATAARHPRAHEGGLLSNGVGPLP